MTSNQFVHGGRMWLYLDLMRDSLAALRQTSDAAIKAALQAQIDNLQTHAIGWASR